MKKELLVSFLIAVCGCGYESVDNELICQPKKIFHQTPLICPNRNDVDVSMGVMRDGVGSMSSQDVYLTVNNPKDLETLKIAINDGKLVKIHYNEYRLVWCQHSQNVTSVEIIDGPVKTEQEKKRQEIDILNKQLQQLQDSK